MRSEIRITAERSVHAQTVSLYGTDREGKYAFTSIQSEATEDGQLISPFVKLTDQEATYLMSSLWDAGIRPVSGEGSAGQLAAIQSHLKDMRTIAFKKLNIEEE